MPAGDSSPALLHSGEIHVGAADATLAAEASAAAASAARYVFRRRALRDRVPTSVHEFDRSLVFMSGGRLQRPSHVSPRLGDRVSRRNARAALDGRRHATV
jgi:hypothetical protein